MQIIILIDWEQDIMKEFENKYFNKFILKRIIKIL